MIALMCSFASRCAAFSPLGPFPSWMDPTYLEYCHSIGDVGGPMTLEESYRWNVPYVTYDYSPSFIEQFGERGISEVEEAIAAVNGLPPADEMDLSSIPLITQRTHFQASSEGLLNLRSSAMTAVVEALGLGPPQRSIGVWQSAQIVSSNGTLVTNHTVIQRNYDPESLMPSQFVNGDGFISLVRQFQFIGTTNRYYDAIEWPMDPYYAGYSALADNPAGAESFFLGLSRDDAGGLRYLYRSTNVRSEPLLADVQVATNQIGTGLRPGINKLQLVRASVTNVVFADRVFSNGVVVTQWLTRVVVKPDILFDARDLGVRSYSSPDGVFNSYVAKVIERSTSGVWLNNSSINGKTGGDGPGVIGPGWKVTFSKLGRYASLTKRVLEYYESFSSGNWAAYDMSTNPIVQFGLVADAPPVGLGVKPTVTSGGAVLDWTLLGAPGKEYRIDASTNLTHWCEVGRVTNLNGIFHFSLTNSSKSTFIRAISP